eukprot:59144-Rhodomonas_salina.1
MNKVAIRTTLLNEGSSDHTGANRLDEDRRSNRNTSKRDAPVQNARAAAVMDCRGETSQASEKQSASIFHKLGGREEEGASAKASVLGQRRGERARGLREACLPAEEQRFRGQDTLLPHAKRARFPADAHERRRLRQRMRVNAAVCVSV